jgi:hypothetical protein
VSSIEHEDNCEHGPLGDDAETNLPFAYGERSSDADVEAALDSASTEIRGEDREAFDRLLERLARRYGSKHPWRIDLCEKPPWPDNAPTNRLKHLFG